MSLLESLQFKNFSTNTNRRLNWLRASVLGANDGIVSTAGLVVGVAGATMDKGVILAAGMAGVIAGAISMAAGEYVSVSSQRDSEKAMLAQEKIEIEKNPGQEFEELTYIYMSKGLSEKTARTVAKEFTEKDPYAAHVDAELKLDPNNLTNPWHAAIASALAFTVGAVIPLTAILLPPASIRIPFAFVSVLVALVITGTLSAIAGRANIARAVLRVVLGGAAAMIVTYEIGRFFGVRGI